MAEFELYIGTRFTGIKVIPDSRWPGMWRISHNSQPLGHGEPDPRKRRGNNMVDSITTRRRIEPRGGRKVEKRYSPEPHRARQDRLNQGAGIPPPQRPLP